MYCKQNVSWGDSGAFPETPAALPNPGPLEGVSHAMVNLFRRDLSAMIGVVRTLFRLGENAAYRERIHGDLADTARFDPGHDAVMMGYDFHLTPEGPVLIEVNTNAGGLLHACRARGGVGVSEGFPPPLARKLLATFASEMRTFRRRRKAKPSLVAIVDEEPQNQFLFPEMEAFSRLFESWGARAVIVDPQRLDAGSEGVFFEGERVDLVYNRHCDFYLASPAMAGMKAAYLARQVCLTPNPFVYGLLGDKRRMVLWSDPQALTGLGLDPPSRDLLLAAVPQSRILASLDPEEAWGHRKDLVFKPAAHFGSRGVLVGGKISRKRFAELPPNETLVQRYAPPSLTPVPGSAQPMKTDLRLYAYRDRTFALAARLYHGQVTNLRTPGGGFAPVRIATC